MKEKYFTDILMSICLILVSGSLMISIVDESSRDDYIEITKLTITGLVALKVSRP